MNESREKMEENNKNLELSINFIKRNDDKKKTISLSETPNIINDETLNIDRRKSDASSLFQILWQMYFFIKIK